MNKSGTTAVNWPAVAEGHARKAFSEYESMEWGQGPDPVHPDTLVIFHNWTYVGYGGLRLLGWDLLRRWLMVHRIEVLAEANYPTDVPDVMSAKVMMVRVTTDRRWEVDYVLGLLREYVADRLWESFLSYNRITMPWDRLGSPVPGDQPTA
jgi:hypothetical protein